MASTFDGTVLQGALVAPSNSQTTGEPDTGVIRDPRGVPQNYTLHAGVLVGEPPSFVDPRADQYRAAVLEAPGTAPQEYLVWAQNTSQLAVGEDASWWTELGTGIFSSGTLTVGSYEDGSARVVVTDDGSRSIGRIFAVVVARGDVTDYDDDGWKDPNDVDPASWGGQPRKGNNPYLTLYFDLDQQDPYLGVANLDAAHLSALGGGFSAERGDQVILVHYSLAAVRYWWTRNDRYEQRFGWMDRTRRWEPFKGQGAVSLGALLFDGTYRLTPWARNLPVGATLAGDAAVPDSYATLRLGADAGAQGTPVAQVRVKAESVIAGFDFSTDPSANAVVGQASGTLVFNPAFVQLNAGKTIWYSPKSFSTESTGVVGKLVDAAASPLYIAPVPGPTDRPLLRLGSRKHLTPYLYGTEADLTLAGSPLSGEVYVVLSTGRLLFSSTDVDKSDPNKSTFDPNFLGTDVVYDGLALCGEPQPVKASVQLVDAAGNPGLASSSQLFIPDAIGLPFEFTTPDLFRGLGVSGILDAPDGTGALPAYPGVPASLRPGGDSLAPGTQNTGRIRQVPDGLGDTILFSQQGAIKNLVFVDTSADFPSSFKVPQGTAYVSRYRDARGSEVLLGAANQQRYGDDPVYFLQATFTPATVTTEARLYSRNRDVFRFVGDEVLYFVIDGVYYAWDSATLLAALPSNTFFTPAEVASSIQDVIDTAGVDPTTGNPVVPGPGSVYELNGHIVLESDTPASGTVEIGYGTNQHKDLTGSAVLGFLPGWRVQGGVTCWLPDSGAALGLFRSPLNLDRSQATPDSVATSRIEDALLQSSIPGNPYEFLDQVPLQDVAGFDDGVFFSLATTVTDGDTTQIIQRTLSNFVDVVYRFSQRKFDWVQRETVAGVVDQATTTLNLEKPGVVPESMLAAPIIGGGLYVAQAGGAAVLQSQEDDYVLPLDGSPGTAQLVIRYGKRVLYGAQGSFTTGGTTFTDPSVDFTGIVAVGYRLKLTSSDAAGSYVVGAVAAHTLITTPAFTVTPTQLVTWEVYEGYTDSVYDPTIVADVVYQEFNHLPTEPFQVRQLSRLGSTPSSPAEQLANRLKANVAGAIASDRIMSLRFSLAQSTVSNTAQLVALTTTSLGPVANDTLVVPDVTSVRFTSAAFSIWVGTSNYIPVGVATFSPDPVGVEYLTVISGANPIGRLKFGSSVLSAHAAATVFYAEEFLDPSDLGSGTAEFNPNNGLLNLSTADMTTHATERAYFVEQLVTEGKKDVSISPLLGAFSPNQPVPQQATIETEYWAADLEGRKVGNQITEFLPVFVRDELATYSAPNVFLFNGALNTVDTRIDPTIYLGSVLQNYGRTDYLLDYPANLSGQGRITFLKDVSSTAKVKVTYAIFEAQGGERSFEASQKNLYRPPFFIKAAQNQFGLRGDRVSEFQVGQLLRLGEDCFYIRSLLYYPPNLTTGKGDVTAVGIFPSTVDEVGSRAPGNDVLMLITPGPITTTIDPDGSVPVPTTAPVGLMSTVDINLFPFEPVAVGQKTIIFGGNLTTFAVPGHVLELGGNPYTISNVDMTADGAHTKITVTGGFRRNYSVALQPTVKLSYRPIYPPDTRDFLGVGPVLETEPFELVLYGEIENGVLQPGRTLTSGVEYDLDTSTGKLRLMAPLQNSLQPNQSLLLTFTKVRALQPFIQNGMPVIPRYYADFLYVATPDEQNGLLGGELRGTYTFSNPDSFYFRAVRMAQFMGEMASEAVAEISSKQPAGGPILPSPGSHNWEHGRFGLLGERKRLRNKDRVARTFLDFYNSTIQSFEQVLETIDGRFIGDRDGKFRFWVGYDKDYPTPGYEDGITGLLSPRNVWAEVYSDELPSSLDLTVLTTDWVVEPASVSLSSGQLVGTLMDPSRLDDLLIKQGTLVKNDVDDVMLVRLGRAQLYRSIVSPYYGMHAKGVFSARYEQHRFSRLFPTLTKAFLRTMPGVGADPDTNDPGVYTWGRMIDGHQSSTHGKTIGQLSNPVLDEIHQVQNVTLNRRRARARVWGYFPSGIAGGAFNGGGSPAINVPCLVAVATPLSEVLVNPSTGFPENSVFLSAGGDVPDLLTGDPELALPGFATGDQLNWGQPSGLSYPAYTNVLITINGIPSLTGLFVRQVLYGCVVTFQDKDGNSITDATHVLVGTARDQGTPADVFPIILGDTVYVGPLTGTNALPDPPDLLMMRDLLRTNDAYRTGTDFAVKVDGSLVDKTLPSVDDPSWLALKELTVQCPPDPLSTLQGVVEFGYDSDVPLEIPALQGGLQDDSGDYQLPYLRSSNTELDRLGGCNQGLSGILSTRTPFGYFVYPDEILGNDGVVNDAAGTLPATLLTASNIFPGSFTFGTGDIAQYDLLLMQTEVGNGPFTTTGGPVQGPQGILTVGECSTVLGPVSLLEPPRFVSHTKAPAWPTAATGDVVRYQLDNAMSYVDGLYGGTPQTPPLPDGVIIRETDTEVILTFTGASALELTSDGVTVGLGNLNDIIKNAAEVVNNVLVIDILSRPDVTAVNGPALPLPSQGANNYIALSIILTGDSAQFVDYDGGSQTIATTPVFGAPGVHQIYIPKPAALPTMINWGPGAGTPDQWFLPYAAFLPVRQTIYGLEWVMGLSTRNPGKSQTAWIGSDRLTFNEVCDLSFAKPRGYVHPLSGESWETKLVVYEYTVGLTAGTDARCNLPMYSNGLDGLGNPIPFTFVPRLDLTTVGYWQPRVAGPHTLERGHLKVMGLEGYDNTPITTVSPATFSAVPSSIMDETGNYICRGSGVTGSKFNTDIAAAQVMWDNRVTEIAVTSGAVHSVVPGDILVIKSSTNLNHPATVEAGTYIIKHAVEATVPFDFKQVTPTTVAGQEKGWCPLHFPTVVAFDSGANLLTISDLASVRGGTTVSGKLCGFSITYGASPRVYVIRNLAGLASTDATTWKNSVISACYTLITSPGASDLAYFTLTDYRDANDAALTAAQFDALLDKPYQVSGMRYWPVNVSGAAYGLPENNCVGFDSDGVLPPPGDPYAIYGFHWLTLYPPSPLFDAAPLLFGGNTALPPPPPGVPQAYPIRKVPAADTVVPGAYTVISGLQLFQADPLTPVYPWVVYAMYMGNLTDARWNELNIPTGSYGDPAVTPAITPEISCVLPGTTLTLGNEWEPVAGAEGPSGFWAQGGIFLEPSVPRTCLNLDATHAHIVDAAHALPNPALGGTDDWDRELGMRNLKEYDPTGVGTFSDPDEITFEVRRIRRFHTAEVALDFQALRYAYEIRRGFISSYSTSSQQRGEVEASQFTMNWTSPVGGVKAQDVWDDGTGPHDGTNLGPFTSEDVNINAGDVFRLLDENGALLDSVEIATITSDSTLKLAPPGLTYTDTLNPTLVGYRFEIYLKQTPVPHEQSNEQLLDLITTSVITSTNATWAAGTGEKGGYVPDLTGGDAYSDVANQLCDDLNADGGTSTFSALGVRKGDIVLVDPVGKIPRVTSLPTVQEQGVRPLGDLGVSPRVEFIAKSPDQGLDDNRGFYRVALVVDNPSTPGAKPYLQLNPVTSFTGDETTPVVFDSTDNTRAYAVYPTVTDSLLRQAPYPDPGAGLRTEGQMDLRPTRARDAVTKSFRDRGDAFIGHSIRPFSYKIIRPSALFSDEAIDLVLTLRERMLSLIELLQSMTSGFKTGSFFIFQRDEHCGDLGDTLNPLLGLGVPSNAFINLVQGQLDTMPYLNNEGCLSLLDRRFWILDSRLDSLTYDPLIGGMKLAGGGDTPYTAYNDVSGSLVRPVEPDRITDVLDSTDQFRPVRYVWLSYRTHKTLGTLASIALFDKELPKRLTEQKASMLVRTSLENV